MKIKIKRTSQWNNKYREIELYSNVNKIGSIRDGETKVFNIDSNSRMIYAKIDWCRSKSIKLDQNQETVQCFQLSSYKFGAWFLPTILVIILLHFIVTTHYGLNSNYFVWIAGLLCLYPAYYLTIGKNRYLKVIKIIN